MLTFILKSAFRCDFLCSGKNTHRHKPHHVPFNQASESQHINFCFPSATAMALRHWWTREAHTLAPKCTSSTEEHMLPWLVSAPNQQNKLAISSGISVPLQSFGAVWVVWLSQSEQFWANLLCLGGSYFSPLWSRFADLFFQAWEYYRLSDVFHHFLQRSEHKKTGSCFNSSTTYIVNIMFPTDCWLSPPAKHELVFQRLNSESQRLNSGCQWEDCRKMDAEMCALQPPCL